MSNEFYDVAACGDVEMADDALHCLAPDEVIMRAEEAGEPVNDARARCLLSVIMAITWNVVEVRQIRDRLGVVCSYKAPDLVPEILWNGRAAWDGARRAMVSCPRIEWEDASGRVLIELLTAAGWSEREIGKRALCLLYAFQPDKSVRPVIANSLGAIGRALGSTAGNPRAGVSDAMQRIVLEMQHRMERLTRRKGTGEFWFMKSVACRERLAVAMMGKRNRKKKGDGVKGEGLGVKGEVKGGRGE